MGKINNIEQSQASTMIEMDSQETLLVLCARLNLSSEARQQMKDLITEGIDWDILTQKASWHRVLTLVAHHLLSLGSNGLVPKDVTQKMRSISYSNLARNMILQDELVRIVTEFNSQNVPVIILKGAAMLESIYRDISLRQMSDLDILVRPEHLDKAEKIALEQGYNFLVDTEIQKQTKEGCRHLANLWHREKKIVLEIHHHIVSPNESYQFNLEGFWERAKTIKLLGTEALIFAPEDNLIHLCINFLFDRKFESEKALGQLSDISELIKYYKDTLDWDLVQRVARLHGLSSAVYLSLYTCQQLLETPILPDVMMKFRPMEFDPSLADLFIKRRVLDTKPWLAHGLANSKPNQRHFGTFLAIISRFSNIIKDTFKKSKVGTKRGHVGLKRIGDILPRLIKTLLKPSELKNDLKLDRWLHDIYKVN
jgi:hypothetical protein